MDRRRRSVALAGVVVAVLALAGCGGRTVEGQAVGGTIAGQPTDAASSDASSDADTDAGTDSGTDAGTGDSGTGDSGTGDSGTDGGGTTVGDGTALPDGWPPEVPPVPGFTLQTSARTETGGNVVFTAVWTAPGDRADDGAAYVDTLVAGGFEVQTSYEGSGDAGTGSFWVLTNGATQVTVTVSDQGQDETGIVVTVQEQP